MSNVNNSLDPDWDKKIESLHGHLFQSSAWKVFQHAQGRNTLQESSSGWAWLGAIRTSAAKLKYLYAAYGPVFQSETDLKPAIDSIIQSGKDAGVDFVRLEPFGPDGDLQMKRLGARKVQDVQPSHRMVLDLKPTEQELFANVSQTTRNYINTSTKRGLEFEISTNPKDLPKFLDMQHQTAKNASFTMHPDSYYQDMVNSLIPLGVCKLYFAKAGDKHVASAICVDFGPTRYYLFAGTEVEANKSTHAAPVLLWWLIADAKKAGLTSFDFGGVVPLDWEDHPWIGHTRFKAKFNGQVVKNIGSWDIPIKKAKYQLYSVAKHLRGSD